MPDRDYGDILLEWHFPEYQQYHRGRWWYLWFFLIPALLITEAIWVKSYLFIPIVVLAIIILLTRLRRAPQDMHVALREDGLQLNHRFYRWDDFNHFWIIYRPPEVKKLFLDFHGARPNLDLHLGKMNPLKVREALNEFIPENIARQDEPFGDQLSRVLKI